MGVSTLIAKEGYSPTLFYLYNVLTGLLVHNLKAMKKAIFILLALITLNTANAQFTRDSLKSIRNSLPSGIYMKTDQMEGVIWITSKKIFTDVSVKSNYFQLYFGIFESGKIGNLRIVNSITLSSWIFMEKAIYLVGGVKMKKADEQKRFELYFGEITTNVNANATVTEKSDDICTANMFEFFKYQIEKRAFIKIRYSGKNTYINRSIFGGKAANTFGTMLDVYEKFKNSSSKN